ncbi:MAG TPA: energy-coupling factor transporter ATPase [Firmicutes bacterium]|jgi:energy-coupling factor transport system ATP-binding protein|nr:energy-coupling factor transporter ATPase [Bacillota bacterium]
MLEVKNLSHIYMAGTPFQVTALKDVSLKVEKGEFIGIIGETGSGKSTLVQHFNGLLKPTSGDVLLGGENIWSGKISMRAIRSRVALLFQYPEHQLFEETVYKDVAFGPRNLGLSEKDVKERVCYALKLMGLDYKSYKDRSPFSLSGGEKRRVAMAGILAMKPEVIILDEPTAGMDPSGRRHLLKQIEKLHREENITVIMVTHNMDEVSRLADRLFVFSAGRLVLQGRPAEVFNSAKTIKEIGLELPVLSELLQKLRNSGKNIRTDLFSVEEVGREILEHYRRG